MTKPLRIEADCDGARLDRYLAEREGLTRSAVQTMIGKGLCRVNGAPAVKSVLLKNGDIIELERPAPEETELSAEDIPLDIAYEDEHLLVVNKPRGLVVHPAHGHMNGTLVNALMFHCKDGLSGINGEIRPGIVHRIDKNTSGLLLVAKDDFTHNGLAEQIKAHTLKRQYEAVVHGAVKAAGTVNAPIARHKTDRKKMCVAEGGRAAVTHYEAVEMYAHYTHLRLRLETGRTHQIRVHMAYIGHPVAGDDVYGGGKPKWLEGQCLHAAEIGFVHPVRGEYMEFSSELPEYFRKMLKQIK